MKLVVAWLAVVALAVITAGSCSVNHRSGDYACTAPGDCRDGRVCVDNFCVAPGTTPIDASRADAPTPQPDANLCPAQCSSCNVAAKECKIDCAVKSCVGTQIVCPQGWNCDVLCSTPNSCRSTTQGSPAVICTGTLSCNVTCTGNSSCRNVACGLGPCNVDCSGAELVPQRRVQQLVLVRRDVQHVATCVERVLHVGPVRRPGRARLLVGCSPVCHSCP